MTSVIRITTVETADIEKLLRGMDACINLRLPFYYSGRRRVIRAQSRNKNKIRLLEIELKDIGLKTIRTYY